MKSQISRAREAGFAPSAGRHYLEGMTDRPKRPRDANQLAKFIVDLATGEATDALPPPKAEAQQKGGRKGGAIRASNLPASKRSEIATNAAQARWGKEKTK